MYFCFVSSKAFIITPATMDMAKANAKNSYAMLRRSCTVWLVKCFVRGAFDATMRVKVIDPPKMHSD